MKTAAIDLDNYGGWRDVLLNVSAAILGLGVFYALALGVHYAWTGGEHLFFHCEPELMKEIKRVVVAQSELLRI